MAFERSHANPYQSQYYGNPYDSRYPTDQPAPNAPQRHPNHEHFHGGNNGGALNAYEEYNSNPYGGPPPQASPPERFDRQMQRPHPDERQGYFDNGRPVDRYDQNLALQQQQDLGPRPRQQDGYPNNYDQGHHGRGMSDPRLGHLRAAGDPYEHEQDQRSQTNRGGYALGHDRPQMMQEMPAPQQGYTQFDQTRQHAQPPPQHNSQFTFGWEEHNQASQPRPSTAHSPNNASMAPGHGFDFGTDSNGERYNDRPLLPTQRQQQQQHQQSFHEQGVPREPWGENNAVAPQSRPGTAPTVRSKQGGFNPSSVDGGFVGAHHQHYPPPPLHNNGVAQEEMPNFEATGPPDSRSRGMTLHAGPGSQQRAWDEHEQSGTPGGRRSDQRPLPRHAESYDGYNAQSAQASRPGPPLRQDSNNTYFSDPGFAAGQAPPVNSEQGYGVLPRGGFKGDQSGEGQFAGPLPGNDPRMRRDPRGPPPMMMRGGPAGRGMPPGVRRGPGPGPGSGPGQRGGFVDRRGDPRGRPPPTQDGNYDDFNGPRSRSQGPRGPSRGGDPRGRGGRIPNGRPVPNPDEQGVQKNPGGPAGSSGPGTMSATGPFRNGNSAAQRTASARGPPMANGPNGERPAAAVVHGNLSGNPNAGRTESNKPFALPVRTDSAVISSPPESVKSPTAAKSSNPDALPFHPAPVRPGHSEDAPTDRPAPVRQYTASSAAPAATSQPAKRKSDPVTEVELNRLRDAFKGNPADAEKGLRLAKKLIEASIVLAPEGGRADPRTVSRNKERYLGEAHKLLKKLASGENAQAQFFLADCLGTGALGIDNDPKEAFQLYQAAAKLRHPQAAYRTAFCCELGPEEGGGTRKDDAKAIQWYKRAANLGDLDAMFKCGMICIRGLLGSAKSPAEGVAWLQRAVEIAGPDHPHAFHELAKLHEDPSTLGASANFPKDEVKAFQLFKKAAGFGYKHSQFRLGQAFEYGMLGTQVDSRQSIIWYTKAAAQSEHQSELALSGWYLTGAEGILEHSDTEAYLWARKAATSDPPLPKALFALGYYTEVGIGCPRSLDEAKKWYGRAAAYKFPKAQERLEELRKGGARAQKNREKLSRTDQKQTEESCTVM